MKSVMRGIQAGWLALLLVLGITGTVVRMRAATLVEIAAGNPDFSTLVAAVQAAGLAETLAGPGPLTVFAPNNAAFAKLPPGTVDALLADPARLRQVLLYHVVRSRVRSTDLVAGAVATVQGAAVRVSLTGGVKVNDSNVIAADIEAANGVVHVIDSVLLPPPDLVQVAVSNPEFSTLVTALQAAGLVDALKGPGPFTVFAPNNAAFAKLPPGTIEALLADTNRLRHILLYHVHSGPRINQARVLAANVEAGNGVIHVIDEVILPGGGFVPEGAELSVVVLGGEATVVWPAREGAAPVLESAPSPAGPWTAVSAPIATADGIQKVKVPATAANQFFRLRR